MALRIVPLILLAFPLLELGVAVLVAQHIGWWLLAWLVVAAVLGVALIRAEQSAVLGRLVGAVQAGMLPFDALWRSGRWLLAGLLLIFPGVISDLIALVLLLWPGGRVAKMRAAKPSRDESHVIEGEFRRED